MRQSTPASVSRRLAVGFGLLLPLTAAATALAAPKAAETRTLLLTQRFTPDTAPAASDPLATSLVALRGQTEVRRRRDAEGARPFRVAGLLEHGHGRPHRAVRGTLITALAS